MRRLASRALAVCVCPALLAFGLARPGQAPPRTGPATEKRFPPLRVPPGFKPTLFACDPLIEYPSAIALGPRAGSLFVAVDYLTGLGTQVERRDEIRLVEDTDGDGYADRATVYAGRFNSIQGLAYHNGTVYVMHAPLLTALRDTDGDGKADERRDLVAGLGLPPEKNPPRLHCANGVVVGHDGWLYLVLGDHGCDVKRPEGDRLVLVGGGILRCRPDGRGLHVLATGLRNVYDVALDEELSVFVRDNENDGGDYKVRVCHSFHGADHGYPYLYDERPDEALPPLADLGLGSSAGGVCYLERQFPAEYRGSLFFCEWGRAVMRYRPERAGAGFAPLKEVEFAAGDPKDLYPFKPTDLVVDRDGSLLIADWADGQRPKRGRGRIYRIRHADEKAPAPRPAGGKRADALARLDSESYHERVEAQEEVERQGRPGLKALVEELRGGRLGVRGRLHAVWVLARAGGPEYAHALIALARSDPEPRVQAQAVRALADLADPVLLGGRLDARPGDADLAARLAALAEGRDPRVVLEVIVALGRLRWADTPAWLAATRPELDPALAHAAMQALRRSGNWPAVLKLLDRPGADPLRAVALRAVADQAVPAVVDGLIERLGAERDAGRRRAYADALTRVHRKPGPQPYWGYRPAPRPPNAVAWERTDAIGKALDAVLADPDRGVRLVALRRMQREKIVAGLPALGAWLLAETDAERLGAVLESLGQHPPAATRDLLAAVAADRKVPAAGRVAALTRFAAGLDGASEGRLGALAGRLEEGPVLASALRLVGGRPKVAAAALVLRHLEARDAEVRAAALDAAGALKATGAAEAVRRGLQDPDARVRRAAAGAAGELGVEEARGPLLKLARDGDAGVRRASLGSLRLLREPRAVPAAADALADPETQAAALACIADLGGPEQARAVVALARRSPSADVLLPVVRALTRWRDRPDAAPDDLDAAVADLQGASGLLVRWQVAGPVPARAAERLAARLSRSADRPEKAGAGALTWQTVFAAAPEARVTLPLPKGADAGAVWLAYADLRLAEPAAVQLLPSGKAVLRLWQDGRHLYRRQGAPSRAEDAGQVEVRLPKGWARFVVELSGPANEAEFALRFRRTSTKAEHERLTRAALSRPGNAERGRQLFFDVKKSQCLLCHRLGDRGERIGPDLSGVGSRFARIHLIESILEPSRTVTPGYQTVVVTLKDGRVLTGVKTAETAETLTLGDSQGKRHVLARRDIASQRAHPLSTMPEGLERAYSADEFVDLIAFLASQKDRRPR
jgi:putative membrane-bound dehydrogenase-like protein